MSATSIPGADRRWLASQESDIYGHMVATKNLSFVKKGYLALARKAIALYTETQDSDFGTILAMYTDTAQLYLITTSRFFRIDLSGNVITATKYIASDKPVLGFQSDMVSFNGKPHVSGTQIVKSYEPTDDFTQRITGLSSSYPHPMVVHEGRQTLLVADGNTLRQYSTGYAEDTDNKLTIPSDYIITRILYWNSNAYALTRNINGGHAKVFAWNGVGVGHNGAWGVGADWAYSGCEYGASFAIITSKGQVLPFNGAGFDFNKPLANFPVYYTDGAWTSNAATTSLIGNVASRGMEADGSLIHIVINGGLNVAQGSPIGRYLPDMPSGLWTYDPKVGLTHQAGAVYSQYLSMTPSGIASNRLVFSTPHQALTGDAVLASFTSGITGLNAGQTYYAIVEGANALQLALTPADAKNGNAITVGGTPSIDKFCFNVYDSMGSGQITNAGPVFVLKSLSMNPFYGSRLLFASRANDAGLDPIGSLMSLGLGRNIGYFKMPKIASSSITEVFQKIIAKFPHLNLDSEDIVMKYRSDERFGAPTHAAYTDGAVMFTSATTFEVDMTQKDFLNVEEGDEVEFTNGAAAGYVAHITNIDKSNPASYVITIDETLPVSNGDLTDCIADNWKKYAPRTNADKENSLGYGEIGFGKSPSTWVQCKVAIRGRAISLEMLMLISVPNKKAE